MKKLHVLQKTFPTHNQNQPTNKSINQPTNINHLPNQPTN